jgi:hypothetical protein
MQLWLGLGLGLLKCLLDTITYVKVSGEHFELEYTIKCCTIINQENRILLLSSSYNYKIVNITVFPHLYKFNILLLLKTLRKNCSIQQTLYTEVYYIKDTITYVKVSGEHFELEYTIKCCTIINNGIGHKFHNLQTSSPIQTRINTTWTYIYIHISYTSSNQNILPYLYSKTYQNRNKSWKPECVLSFNMNWRILVTIINNGIGHKFHNLQTSSPIHTRINTTWTYIYIHISYTPLQC